MKITIFGVGCVGLLQDSLTDLRSTELTKYVAKCMLAIKVSFMDEVAKLAGNF